MADIVQWQVERPDEGLQQAVQVLGAGGIVACPTETFYALAADALQEAALQRLMEIKGRPAEKALLVLVADPNMVREVAEDVPPAAAQLMAHFWPGPLTLILPARAALPRQLTGPTRTIGVRQSGHPLARQLCRLYGRPLTGTSANLSGEAPLTRASQVQQELGALIDLILSDSPCPGGLPSTILDVTAEPPRLVRSGAVVREELEKLLGRILA
jgi:L-threonylcarbamoyladenylate synthase